MTVTDGPSQVTSSSCARTSGRRRCGVGVGEGEGLRGFRNLDREHALRIERKDAVLHAKTAAVDGSFTQEYKNIKIGGQPDSLFEVPAGYKKMTMPGVPPGRGAK